MSAPRLLIGAVAGAAAGVVALLGIAQAQDSRPSVSQAASVATGGAAKPPLVAKGEYLARAADCAACHTLPGGRAYAGGRPFKLPFGTMYATNLTPDPDTGIGRYTDDQFVAALQHGKRRDGANLYPSMPYTSYTGMSREDALSIKAFLFSLPAAHAPAPTNRLWFPFNQRWGMALWNLAFFRDRRFEADTKLTAQQNRGKYLATALGHCGECHTPRNLAYAVTGKQFAGEVQEGWRAYNITSDRAHGVGAWSDQALIAYLTTGHAEGHGSASGNMGEAVENSLQYLTPQDAAALVAYLRTVKPRPGVPGSDVDPAPPLMRASGPSAAAPDDPPGAGRRIFLEACASCHMWNGQGRNTPYAALAGSQAVNDPTATNLLQVLLHGARLHTEKEAVFMPSFAAYSDAELAAVANYVLRHFGGKAGAVTPDQIQRVRRVGHSG